MDEFRKKIEREHPDLVLNSNCNDNDVGLSLVKLLERTHPRGIVAHMFVMQIPEITRNVYLAMLKFLFTGSLDYDYFFLQDYFDTSCKDVFGFTPVYSNEPRKTPFD